MKLKIIDGYNGGVAHISASMIRDHNISMYGTGDFVLPLGNQFAHEIVNNNNIKIKDGIGVIGGARFVIEYGQTETVTIENGTSGYKRNDIIVAEYEKNSTTLVESVTLKVVKGAIGSTGSDPSLSQGNIRAGATVRQMPLYRVKLNGLTIESVEKMWTAFVTPIEKGGTGAATAAAAVNNLMAFGLTGGTSIPSNADLNNYKTVGNYYTGGAAISASISNTPITNSSFMLKVFYGYGNVSTGGIIMQKAIKSNTGEEFIRCFNDGTWSSWVKTLLSGSGVVAKKLLWTNASPTSSFAEQTLSLDLSNYDAVEIQHCYANNANDMLETGIYQKGYTKQYMKNHYEISTSSGVYYIAQRLVEVTASGITFGKGMLKNVTGTTNGSEGNYYCCPLKIYGIKGV